MTNLHLASSVLLIMGALACSMCARSSELEATQVPAQSTFTPVGQAAFANISLPRRWAGGLITPAKSVDGEWIAPYAAVTSRSKRISTGPQARRDEILELQRMLRLLGFDVGVPDGAMGERTQRAIRAFQRTHRLQADGVAGPATVDRLRRLAAGRPPVAEYAGRPNNPRLVEMWNMAGAERAEGCFRGGPVVGTIVKREFADDEMTIVGIVVRDSSDERSYFNIESDRITRMSMVSQGHYGSLVARGRQVMVWAYACGAAGRVWVADRIKASP